VLLDGAKGLYAPVLSMLEPHVKPGTLIVADNADRTPSTRSTPRRPGE